MNKLPIEDKRIKFYEKVKEGEMEGILIDYYDVADENDNPKDNFYRYYTPSEEENKKTRAFKKRFIKFVIDTNGKDSVRYLLQYLEGHIRYRDNFGYITVTDADRGIKDVYFYGEDEDTAFLHAITGYMFRCGDYYEYNNRAFLAEDFRQRFPDDVREDNYYGPFYFIEYALSTLNTYYKGNIPEQIKAFYERRLGDYWQFDYEKNCIVKRAHNMTPQLIKPEE